MRPSKQDHTVAQVSGKKLLPFLGVIGIGYFVFALYVSQHLGDPARANRARLTADAGIDRMTEEERQDYLLKSIRIDEFAVEPTSKPGADGTVSGMLTVKAKVYNIGDRALHSATFLLTTKDADGKVRSTFREDLLAGDALEPGQHRDFSFKIPDKLDYKDFDYRLR